MSELWKQVEAEQNAAKMPILVFHGGNTGSNPVGDAKSHQA
jgi:hypothetical protein